MTGLQTSPINRTKISSPLDLLRNSDSPSNLLTIETQTHTTIKTETHTTTKTQTQREKHTTTKTYLLPYGGCSKLSFSHVELQLKKC
jgi:hypothetical protein